MQTVGHSEQHHRQDKAIMEEPVLLRRHIMVAAAEEERERLGQMERDLTEVTEETDLYQRLAEQVLRMLAAAAAEYA